MIYLKKIKKVANVKDVVVSSLKAAEDIIFTPLNADMPTAKDKEGLESKVAVNNNSQIDMSLINMSLIKKEENANNQTATSAYGLPPKKFPLSGVNIGDAIDLGSKNSEYFKNFKNQKLIEKLEPYFGLRGEDAKTKLNITPLKISSKEAAELNKFVQEKIFIELKTKWNKDSKIKFNELSTEQATVLYSVAYQYGTSFLLKNGKRMNFYTQALDNNWQGVKDELMDFKDKSDSVNKRHIRAGEYLKQFLDKE